MSSGTSQSTGLLAAAQYDSLYIGRNIINAVIASPGSTVTIYDSLTAGTGKVVMQVINTGTNTLDHLFNDGVRVDIAISVLVTGTSGIVFFGAT